MIILLHTSKTMRQPVLRKVTVSQTPILLDKTCELANYLKTISSKKLVKMMNISPKLALKTHELLASWTTEPNIQNFAIDSFLGDIFSGLQVPLWTSEDRLHANQTLRILSGLYGVIRPLDGIYPYRLEMGYRLPNKKFSNLYNYWGDSIAKTLPESTPILNLAAVEYSKVVTNYIEKTRITTPHFLTINPKTKEPNFVVVHAKIARGAFARWLIQKRIFDINTLTHFQDLGYTYNQKLSTPFKPVFVCTTFGGTGLSIRLKK